MEAHLWPGMGAAIIRIRDGKEIDGKLVSQLLDVAQPTAVAAGPFGAPTDHSSGEAVVMIPRVFVGPGPVQVRFPLRLGLRESRIRVAEQQKRNMARWLVTGCFRQ